MAVRRLAEKQPESFAFSPEALEWAKGQIAKYPEGRQASAVIALLWRAQDEAGGWLPEPAIRVVADMLGMAYIRVLEVATFYTMFNLEPVGRHLVQVCGTTPCMLRGANALKEVCRRVVGPEHKMSDDGNFTWMEVECLGACANAPMVQINADYYEDLTAESLAALLVDLRGGKPVKPGSQTGRHASAPAGALTSLTDPALYDGSMIGAWRKRFEPKEDEAAGAPEEKKS
jgi:NADH-quinone oxidoreductase subunit E